MSVLCHRGKSSASLDILAVDHVDGCNTALYRCSGRAVAARERTAEVIVCGTGTLIVAPGILYLALSDKSVGLEGSKAVVFGFSRLVGCAGLLKLDLEVALGHAAAVDGEECLAALDMRADGKVGDVEVHHAAVAGHYDAGVALGRLDATGDVDNLAHGAQGDCIDGKIAAGLQLVPEVDAIGPVAVRLFCRGLMRVALVAVLMAFVTMLVALVAVLMALVAVIMIVSPASVEAQGQADGRYV